MQKVRMAAPLQDRPDIYRQQMADLKTMRSLYNDAAMASGSFHVQTVNTVSASEALTTSIQKQKVGWKEARNELSAYRSGGQSALRELIKEQTALSQAMATQFTGSAFGKNKTDLFIPRNLGTDLEDARIKYGAINQMLRSAATQTVNWGKNMQWAGRQIMVGISVPIAIAAAGAAVFATQVDQQMTRVIKVYDTVAQDAIGQEQELAQVRKESLDMATKLANQYGASLTDTLNVEAQLAQTGLNGPDLIKGTTQAVRIATLGEMDYQKAVDMTISLQTAYKLSSEDLGKTFDFMNSVENATSLSIQDIADAIPRAASALAGLGVSVQQTTILLAAMKESGVDAAEAANALKTGATKILNPTPEAVNFWQQQLGINLPAVMKKANGNIYQVMVTLGQLTNKLDSIKVEQGIGKLFGAFQFNRDAALLRNLGDAASGVINQTHKAMEIANQDPAQWAQVAETELQRWQSSVQGRFKRTLEGLKAALVPFGAAVMAAVVPILNVVRAILDGFNNLPSGAKTLVMFSLALIGLAGPILMLVGLFGNLFGNFIKLGTWLYSLTNTYKLMSVEERAAWLNSRNMTSAFNTQAQSAAALAAQITALSEAMERQAVAQGLIMGKNGTVAVRDATGTLIPGATRQVVPDANGKLRYAAGSYGGVGGQFASKEDQAAFRAINASAAGTAANAEKTRISLGGAGKAAGAIMGIAAIWGVVHSGSSGLLNTMINIAAIAATVSFIFPGIFKKALSLAKELRVVVASLTVADKLGTLGSVFTRLTTAFKVGGLTGPLGITGQIAQMAPKFAGFASAALKVFGPIGILAGGALIVKAIITDMHSLENIQKDLATTGKDWADALGYTYTPGKLPNMSSEQYDKSANAISAAADKMAKAHKGLAKEMSDATDKEQAYKLAMDQLLTVLTSGGTIDQAKTAFAAALSMTNLKPATIRDLKLRIQNISFDNPNDVRMQFQNQLNNVFGDLNSKSIDIFSVHPTTDSKSWYPAFKAGLQQLFGGDLTDQARAAGEHAGAELGKGLAASVGDPQGQAELYDSFTTGMNSLFADSFKQLQDNPDIKKAMSDLGIKTSDQLFTTLHDVSNGGYSKLTEAEKQAYNKLTAALTNDPNIKGFEDRWNEMLDTIIQGMVDSGNLTDDQAKKIRKAIGSIADLKLNRLGGQLDGVGNAADSAGQKVMSFADIFTNAMSGINQTFGIMQVAPDALVNASKTAMSGAWGDILGEAQRQYDAVKSAQMDAIKQQYQNVADGLDKQSKVMQDSFDQQTQQQKDYWDGVEKNTKTAFDNQTQAMNDYYDAESKGVQDQIDAQQKLDDERQRVFQAEQQRIERLAAMQNSNIDFNVALNSGNLDEAARVANNASAQSAQYNLQDQQQNLDDLSKAKTDSLQAELKNISDAKDAALKALKDRQDAEQAALDNQRTLDERRLQSAQKTAQDSLSAQKDANQKAEDSAVAAAQAAVDADKRGLEERLRALQQFVPTNETELRNHINDVQALYASYGVNLQMQGNVWSAYIGTALETNVDAAAKSLQSDIGWAQIAQNVSDQIGSGLGMTMSQVKTFLTTGVFPTGAQTISPPYTGMAAKPTAVRQGGTMRAIHTGGPAAADRVGVPREASPYNSEILAILKRGEYVVNERQTAKYGPLLEAINSGSIDLQSHHAGGLVDTMSAMTAMGITAIAEAAFPAVQEIQRRIASMNAVASGPNGGYPGSGPTWTYLDAIRRMLFPGSVMTSGYRPGANDWHGAGDAIDIGWPGNAQSGLMPIAAQLAAMYPNATELIHNPNASIKNGQLVPASFWGAATWAEHANHVHWAMTPQALAAVSALQGAPVAGGSNQSLVQSIAASNYGWTGAEWDALYQLVNHESGFRNLAQNPTSSAFGLFQFLNGTWAGTGYAKSADPTIQTLAGLKYVASRYGDPLNAWRFWQANRWYDTGGWMMPGQVGSNGTNKPEPVFTGDQWAILRDSLANSTLMYQNLKRQSALTLSAVDGVAPGGGDRYTISIDLRGAMIKDNVDIEAAVYAAIDKRESKNGRKRVIP